MNLSLKYDEFLSDKEGSQFYFQAIQNELKGNIMECACGSGDLLLLIQQKYPNAYGLDIDSDMLALAKEKGCQNLILNDMLKVDETGTYDCIVCVGDSLNYLDKAQLSSFIQACYNALNDNGVLLMDMHHEDRLEEFKEPYIEEGDLGSWQYLWEINTIENQLIHQFAFYEGDSFDRETVIQTVFDKHDVIQQLNKVVFNPVSCEILVEDEKYLIKAIKEENNDSNYWSHG